MLGFAKTIARGIYTLGQKLKKAPEQPENTARLYEQGSAGRWVGLSLILLPLIMLLRFAQRSFTAIMLLLFVASHPAYADMELTLSNAGGKVKLTMSGTGGNPTQTTTQITGNFSNEFWGGSNVSQNPASGITCSYTTSGGMVKTDVAIAAYRINNYGASSESFQLKSTSDSVGVSSSSVGASVALISFSP